MSSGFGIEIPRIENAELFEDLCFDLLEHDKDYENVQKNGRRGQKQDGVDIFARKAETSEWIGIQCKVKTGGAIEAKEIENEINKALTFNPSLASYFIYTTAKRDALIQEYVRNINVRNLQAGWFRVQIFFWEDIEDLLKDENYKPVHYKYYRQLYTTFKDDGYSFGKLVGLTVSYRGDASYYELLIGRVYKTTEMKNKSIALDYWKDINFIMNMNERAFETFPSPCHPSALERAISNARDRYIISQWLNSIEDIEKFLKSPKDEHRFEISDEQFEEFLSKYCDYEDC